MVPAAVTVFEDLQQISPLLLSEGREAPIIQHEQIILGDGDKQIRQQPLAVDHHLEAVSWIEPRLDSPHFTPEMGHQMSK